VVIVGEEEWKSGKVLVKDMVRHTQVEAVLDDLPASFKIAGEKP
jgi:histidyl-tRNA synthetase